MTLLLVFVFVIKVVEDLTLLEGEPTMSSFNNNEDIDEVEVDPFILIDDDRREKYVCLFNSS
jgi:hypothetical protein